MFFGQIPWTRQPQSVTPIAGPGGLEQGLVCAPLMSCGGSDMRYQGRSKTLQANSAFQPGYGSMALKGAGTNPQGLNIGTAGFSQIVPVTGGLSVALGIVPFATGVREAFFADWDSVGTNQSIAIETETTNVYRFYISTTPTGTTTVDGGTVVAGRPTHIVCTDDRVAQVHQIYVNGVMTSVGNVGTSRLTGTTLRVGAPGGYTGGLLFRGHVLYCYIWNRVLTSTEVVQLLANPWQVYAPLQQAVYFGVTAGGGGGFLPYWASQRSRVIGAGVI